MMFYYYRNGQKMGPVSFEELKELVEKGGLEGEIVLENQGGDSYPAGTTSERLSQETEEPSVVVFPVVTPQSSSESTPASDRETIPFENDFKQLFKRIAGYFIKEFKKGLRNLFRRIFQKEGAITDSSSQGNPESPFSKPDQKSIIESNEPIQPPRQHSRPLLSIVSTLKKNEIVTTLFGYILAFLMFITTIDISEDRIIFVPLTIGLASITFVNSYFFSMFRAIIQWLIDVREDVFFFREYLDQKRMEE